MNQTITICIFLILSLSCNVKKSPHGDNIKKDNKTYLAESEKTSNSFTSNVYKLGSTSIDVLNNNFSYSIILTLGDNKQIFDLEKLGIPTKTPDEISWVNEDYACMMTWWSLSFSRHIFLPLKPENKFIFINKDIEATDSINSNVFYIDTVINNKMMTFKAENLLSRKSKKIDLMISPNNDMYPYYDSIKMTKSKIDIWIQNKKNTLNIEGIY